MSSAPVDVSDAVDQTPVKCLQDQESLREEESDGVETLPKKGGLAARLAKKRLNFNKKLMKMADKTEQGFKGLGKDLQDGMQKVKELGSRAPSPSGTSKSRSRANSRAQSRASSLQRGLQLRTIKDAFDNFGQKITSMQRGQELTVDDVFGAEADGTEDDTFKLEEFTTATDWGESWPSFDNFDSSLYNLKDKTNGLTMLISDMCDAESKYAKRVRDIAGAHLKAYQKSHSKLSNQKFAERTKHIAMMKLLQTLLRFADHHELQSWSLNTFLDSDVKKKIAEATEKMTNISAVHKTAKKDVAHQLNRVKTAKNEYNRRVAQHEAAEQNYVKFQEEHPNGGDIKEEDKLRVQVADKKALVKRATEEHDAQVATYNELQKTYYSEDLPALCRSQKEVHNYLTDIWKNSMEEYARKNLTKIESNQQEIIRLESPTAIGGINKDIDANILFKNTCQDNTLPAPLNTIQDLEQFQFPQAPPRSPKGEAEVGLTAPVRGRKLSEAVCLLGDAELAQRMKQLQKSEDFIVLADGRVFKVGTINEDFDGDYRGAIAIKKGTFIGVTRNEAIKHKTDYDDGWIKVTNLETEQSGYIPSAYMVYVAEN